MQRNTASMQHAWQHSTAARRARSSSTSQGASSRQLAQPSRHRRHAKRAAPSAGTADGTGGWGSQSVVGGPCGAGRGGSGVPGTARTWPGAEPVEARLAATRVLPQHEAAVLLRDALRGGGGGGYGCTAGSSRTALITPRGSGGCGSSVTAEPPPSPPGAEPGTQRLNIWELKAKAWHPNPPLKPKWTPNAARR